MPEPSVASGYVLINTNFPTVNPRFSGSSSDEEGAMVQAGSPASSRASSSQTAGSLSPHAGHGDRACEAFSDVPFVLRPHPFENLDSYGGFADLPNASVIQSGTSLEWISGARLLVHQNCSTAIEATMLNVEPLSMEWFNTPALRLDAATRVSRPARSEAELIELVRQGLEGKLAQPSSEIVDFRREIISDLYLAMDGASSVRVSEAVLSTMAVAEQDLRPAAGSRSPSLRGLAAAAARRTLGHRASRALRRLYGSAEGERRRAGKQFGDGLVNTILQRIDAASVDRRRFVAGRPQYSGRHVQWRQPAACGSELNRAASVSS
ncbi:surface carbohydrate biosynthesis protein [Bradyrhizobium japonicum]